MHECVDELTDIKEANFDNYNSDIQWTISDFHKTKMAIQKFYRQCIINDNIELKSDLPSNIINEIRNCFEIRKNDIFETLVRENLLKNGASFVKNFDWRMKWVLGSSKLASFTEPVLQIDLHCLKSKNDGSLERKTVNFEVNLDKLDFLIEQLEKARNETNVV